MPYAHEIKKVLILEYTGLPDVYKKRVQEYHSFHNDVTLDFYSELEFQNESFSRQGIEEWRTEEDMWDEDDTFAESFDSFVKELHLEFELWIIDNFDLAGVEAVQIKVCW